MFSGLHSPPLLANKEFINTPEGKTLARAMASLPEDSRLLIAAIEQIDFSKDDFVMGRYGQNGEIILINNPGKE